MMYQVIQLYGDFEPWWFLDDWKEDVIEQKVFDTLENAKLYYMELLETLKKRFPSFESRFNFLATFWDANDQRWCEECNEDLQQYRSILLLQEDDTVLPIDLCDVTLEESNDHPVQPSSCSLSL